MSIHMAIGGETFSILMLIAGHVSDLKGGNPLNFSMEIFIEMKQFNFGRMASHAFIESIWCSHREIILSSKMDV